MHIPSLHIQISTENGIILFHQVYSQLSELPIQAQSGFIHFAVSSSMFLFWLFLNLFLPILAELGFGFNGIFWILPNLADYGMNYVTIMPLWLNWHIVDSDC